MKIYHYTSVIKWLCIQSKGLHVSEEHGRKMLHPLTNDFKGAIWAFPEAAPQSWIDNISTTEFNLTCLFGHCAAGDTLTLLELDIPDDADLWATDWAYGYKDAETGWRSVDYFEALRRYEGKDHLAGFRLPEVICFDNIAPERIRQIDIPENVRPHVRPIDLMTPPY